MFFLFCQRAYGGIGKRFPSTVLMRAGLVRPYSKCSVEQEYSLFCHRVRLPVAGGSVPVSAFISLKMLTSEGGKGMPSFTEKHKPCACPGPWYGSCPMITTFTRSNGQRLKALNISLPGGNIRCWVYSFLTNSVKARK